MFATQASYTPQETAIGLILLIAWVILRVPILTDLFVKHVWHGGTTSEIKDGLILEISNKTGRPLNKIKDGPVLPLQKLGNYLRTASDGSVALIVLVGFLMNQGSI